MKTLSANTSYARLHVWGKGGIWALSAGNIPRDKIAEIVAKTDRMPLSLRAIDEVIAHNVGLIAQMFIIEKKRRRSRTRLDSRLTLDCPTTDPTTDPRLTLYFIDIRPIRFETKYNHNNLM